MSGKNSEFLKMLKRCQLSDVEINQYICKKQRLDELKTSKAKIINLAKRIKPLVRVCKTYGNEYQKVVKIEDGDGLVFTRFCDITDSYFFHFKGKSSVVQHARRALAVKAPKKVGEFTCYFDFHGRRDFSPCLYDVLCQLPAAISDKVNAFEVVFDSNDPKEAYDVLLDRYEGTVIMYNLIDGLPQQIKGQIMSCGLL